MAVAQENELFTAKFDWQATTGLPWVAHFCRSRCPRQGVLETKNEFWGSRVASIRSVENSSARNLPVSTVIYLFTKTKERLFAALLSFIKLFSASLDKSCCDKCDCAGYHQKAEYCTNDSYSCLIHFITPRNLFLAVDPLAFSWKSKLRLPGF